MNTAILSDDQLYRYYLERDVIKDNDKKLLFIMLNPSVADETEDDKTVRRCMGFAKTLGYGRVGIINQYAYRSTDPSVLKAVNDPIGPDFDLHTCRQIQSADLIICAWGEKGRPRQKEYINRYLKDKTVYALSINERGQPIHPLYAPSLLTPIVFKA